MKGGVGWMKEEEEEKKLELRLGPPVAEDWSAEKSEGSSVGSVGNQTNCSSAVIVGAKRSFLLKTQGEQECGLTSVPPVTNTRAPKTPVVGWPPVRSFRKNLATTSTSKAPKQSSEAATENAKNLFVKINMEGIPIGRKVDLSAYSSYNKLSSAVDELFRGLLAAQADPLDTPKQKTEEKQVITGLLDGSSEYTLVYEDDEGDRMLVGDVPWEMFVSTVKRLRVLKTSELSTATLVSIGRKRMANQC